MMRNHMKRVFYVLMLFVVCTVDTLLASEPILSTYIYACKQSAQQHVTPCPKLTQSSAQINAQIAAVQQGLSRLKGLLKGPMHPSGRRKLMSNIQALERERDGLLKQASAIRHQENAYAMCLKTQSPIVLCAELQERALELAQARAKAQNHKTRICMTQEEPSLFAAQFVEEASKPGSSQSPVEVAYRALLHSHPCGRPSPLSHGIAAGSHHIRP